MTYDEFVAAMGAFLFEQWRDRIGWTADELRGFFAHGIAIEHAQAIADVTDGRFPVTLWPKLVHPPKLLHKRLRRATVNVDMNAEQRLAISRGQSGDQAFRKAIRAKGYTQNGLARAVGVSPAVISLHRNSLRKIPKARAEAIAKLTGWPADARHWPCGIASDAE